MSFKFITQPLSNGRYEPEGIYLSLPLQGECWVVQSWGEHADFYQAFRYQGVPLKGHNGIDLHTTPGMLVCAVDEGHVVELGNEPQGYGRYIKVEHTWGESLYANVGEILVDSGQLVRRNDQLAQSNSATKCTADTYLHFGIRIKPYNRFDGWGGFSDPLPFLDPTQLHFADLGEADETGNAGEKRAAAQLPHPMAQETPHLRRP